MVCSFRMIPNAIKGGECCTLFYEGSTEPSNVAGKKIQIKIMEVDKDGKNDLLAEFESALGKGGAFNHGKFLSERTNRIDSEIHILPTPETINDSTGSPLPIPLEFKPAYFTLKLWGIHTPFVLLMKGDNSEIEDGIFEIGINIIMDGVEIFNSIKMPVFVDCTNLLAENCINAAKFYKENHDELIRMRSVGTHFGDHFRYYLYSIGKDNDFAKDPFFTEANLARFKKDKEMYKLKQTSCIDYVEDSMLLGFKKTGMLNEWKKIWSRVVDAKGSYLIDSLRRFGWTVIYYNPDVKHPPDDGPEGTDEYENASNHTYSYLIAMKKGTYGTIKDPPVIPVDDFIVNYKSTPIPMGGKYYREPISTRSDESGKALLNKLDKIPFGFIIGKGGGHTAMLIYGKIWQVHWDKSEVEHDLFDSKVVFGTTWPYNSGLIAVPANYWKKTKRID